jgi:hypothetical protein
MRIIFIILLIPALALSQSSLDTNDKLLDLIDEMKDQSYDTGFETGFRVAIECMTTAYLQSKYGKDKRTVHEINEYCRKRYNVGEK